MTIGEALRTPAAIATDRADLTGKGNQLQTVVDLLRAREVS